MKKYTISGGLVLNGETGSFERLDLELQDGRITAMTAPCGCEGDLDASGLYVIPGFIDTHVHGSMGGEFASECESFDEVRKWFSTKGVTGISPTIRCLELERIAKAEKNIVRESAKKVPGAKIYGIHIEGPFVSQKFRGVMMPPDIEASVDAFDMLYEAGEGMLRTMTIAPERENALDIIGHAVSKGVNISLGHTDATYAQAMAAIDAGASRATHVFDAMRPLHHRETGILGAVLSDGRGNCEMICDFVHLCQETVRLVYMLKGCEGITLISDAGFMSGLGDGVYHVDGHKRIVENGVCRNEDGRIAGSCVSVLEGAKDLLSLGIPLEQVSVMASLNPAKAMKKDDITGTLKIGYCADLIICDGSLDIKAVFVDGERCA